MTAVVERPRNGCALHGAVQTLSEIGGIVPIVHANGGCAVQNYLANKASGLAGGYVKGLSVPGTNFQERHIIFGGASRLREQIKNTLKVFEGELYIVLNSCESAMVGDDIAAMTREVQEQGAPVIESLLAGFNGDSHYGYETLFTDIFKKLPRVKKIEQNTDNKLVNILGIVPNQDIYFKGDLEEISRILAGIGVKSNTFFNSNGVKELETAQNSSLNIVFSKWGIKAAEYLKAEYGTDYIVFDKIPTGFDEVKKFVNTIGDKLLLCYDIIDNFVEKEKEYFDYYFSRVADQFYKGNFSKKVSVIGDEKTVRQIAEFIKKYLGAKIETIIITDFFPGDENPVDVKSEELKELTDDVKFSQDGKEISGILLRSGSEIIAGSSLEEETAENTDSHLWKISYPVYGQTVLNKTYAGVRGAITLAEDYIREVNSLEKQHREKVLAQIGAFGK